MLLRSKKGCLEVSPRGVDDVEEVGDDGDGNGDGVLIWNSGILESGIWNIWSLESRIGGKLVIDGWKVEGC